MFQWGGMWQAAVAASGGAAAWYKLLFLGGLFYHLYNQVGQLTFWDYGRPFWYIVSGTARAWWFFLPPSLWESLGLRVWAWLQFLLRVGSELGGDHRIGCGTVRAGQCEDGPFSLYTLGPPSFFSPL